MGSELDNRCQGACFMRLRAHPASADTATMAISLVRTTITRLHPADEWVLGRHGWRRHDRHGRTWIRRRNECVRGDGR